MDLAVYDMFFYVLAQLQTGLISGRHASDLVNRGGRVAVMEYGGVVLTN
jgi:hypothetical protein